MQQITMWCCHYEDNMPTQTNNGDGVVALELNTFEEHYTCTIALMSSNLLASLSTLLAN